MCQVNGWGSFSAPWGSETPEQIHLKFGMFDYVHSPTSHAEYGGRRKWGTGWAYGWSCTLACFFNIFGSFNASTAYPDKRGFSLGAPKNVFRWWVCSFGVGLTRGSNLPFLPQNHFSICRIRLSFCMGVSRTALMVNVGR